MTMATGFPWTGDEFEELYVRGATVASEYYNLPEVNAERFDGDWLKTGDIVSVDDGGYIDIIDRRWDVIKSGGEWISSIETKKRLMAHDDGIEAAVISVPEYLWKERPLGCVVPKEGADSSPETLREYLLTERDFPAGGFPTT